MKLKKLRELVPTLQTLTTTTLTGQEDLQFLKLWDEIDTTLRESNKMVELLINKYNIKLEEGRPVDGNIEKFNEAYEANLDTEIKIKNKLDFETIRKLKNENKLPAWVFKIFSEEF